MHEDLAHKRPWLLASLAFGLTLPFAQGLPLPGIALIAWKMCGVGLLVPYALRRHHDGQFLWIALVLGLYALADGVLEQSTFFGGLIFAIGHVTAAALYVKHRRIRMAPSQKTLAVMLFAVTPIVTWYLPTDRGIAGQTALYGLILGTMAAAAWSSNFPRYRVGIGAVMFVASDMILVAQMGPLAGWAGQPYAVWYLYYLGVFLIAVGVVQTLLKRGHAGRDADR